MKTKGKRFLSLIMSVCLCIGMMSLSSEIAMAEETSVPTSGSCGDNVTWKLGEDGVLTISGSGDMYDYSDSKEPWYGNIPSIKKVEILAGVTSIGAYAFYDCVNMTEVIIPSSVTDIGGNAFRLCSSLKKVELPEGLTAINEYTFADCDNLTECIIPEGVTSIGYYAFARCNKLEEIKLPNTLTNIDDSAFTGCMALSEITIPKIVTEIGIYAFSNCSSLKSATVLADISYIPTGMFQSCKLLEEVVFPETITTIKPYAFNECTSLNEISIPSTVTYIGENAFYNCTALKNIVIPENVKILEGEAFGIGISEVVETSVRFLGDAPQFVKGESTTDDPFIGRTVTAYYPAGNATWTEEKMQSYSTTSITWVPNYSILSGANSTIFLEENSSLAIRVDGNIDKFVSVFVDKAKVDSSNYDVTEGSTIVTFKTEYLETLTEGVHEVKINFTDGSVTTTFTIDEAEDNTGNAGEVTPDSTDESEDTVNSDVEINSTEVNSTENSVEVISSVQTGDSNTMFVWMIALLASVVCAVSVVVKKKNR